MKIDDYGFLVEKTSGSVFEADGFGLVYSQDDEARLLEKGESIPLEDLLGVNLRSPCLGYAPIGEKVDNHYLMRIPGRFYRVGIYRRNLEPEFLFDIGIGTLGDVLTKIKYRKYPLFHEAYRNARDYGKIQAFSKRYAVAKNGLHFRGALLSPITNGTLVFNSQEERDFHVNNLFSLGFDLKYDVKEKKKVKVLDPFEEDV